MKEETQVDWGWLTLVSVTSKLKHQMKHVKHDRSVTTTFGFEMVFIINRTERGKKSKIETRNGFN